MKDGERAPVVFHVQDRVATLTLNDPDNRNPISAPDMVEAIVSAIESVNVRDDVSVLVLTGSGSAFSAGGDVKAMRERTGISGGSPMEVDRNYRRTIQRIPLCLYNVEVPTIAAVNGPAIGAGCDLALMCDIRIASRTARFGETFVNLGIIPGDGGAWFLPRRIGYERAAEMIFTGRIIDAQEAHEIGMVFKVVEPASLMRESRELAQTIAARPPAAIRMAKRLLRQSASTQLRDFLDACAAYQALAHHTDDHMEAIAAFFEKRPAAFRGA